MDESFIISLIITMIIDYDDFCDRFLLLQVW